jgi:hypothetical protein
VTSSASTNLILTETAESFAHALDWLYRDSRDRSLDRIRTTCAFRGMDEASFTLETSLSRLQGRDNDVSHIEGSLLRNFKKYAHRDVVSRDTIWHWLAVAQHHGIPTRLLDWTFSPLVALHFAVADIAKFHIDGVVWAVKFIEAHKLLPDQLTTVLQSKHARVFDVDMLAESGLTLESLATAPEDDFALFFQPPSLDDRIVNQYALFSLLSHPQRALDDWLNTPAHCALGRKLIIPAALKWDIRDMLDQANINERVLFPGLDGLSAWLKRYYSPKR